jgi:hypothetical protein
VPFYFVLVKLLMARSSSPSRAQRSTQSQPPASPMFCVGQGLWWFITTFARMLVDLLFGDNPPIIEFSKLDQNYIEQCKRRSDPSYELKQYLFKCMRCTDPELANTHYNADLMFEFLNGKRYVHLSNGLVVIPQDYIDLIEEIARMEKPAWVRFWG